MAPPLPERALRQVMVSVFLLGCRSQGPLVDTPIIGGTPQAHEAIRSELAAFEAAVGEGRTRVSRIVIRDLGPKKTGIIRPSRKILLDDDLTVETDDGAGQGLQSTLRHELCHSLNRDENLHHEHRDLYERRSRAIEESGRYELLPHGREALQDEAFVLFCEHGPWVALAALADCPGDPEDNTAILRHLAERVWIHADAPRPTEPGPEIAGYAERFVPLRVEGIGYLGGRIDVTGTFPGAAYDPPRNHDVESSVCLDAETGESVSSQECHDRFPEPWPSQLPPGLPASVDILDWARGWPEGPFAGQAELSLDGPPLTRLVWFDGERWDLLRDGRVGSAPSLFANDDELFDFRLDDTWVSWGLAGPRAQ